MVTFWPPAWGSPHGELRRHHHNLGRDRIFSDTIVAVLYPEGSPWPR